MFVWSFSDLHAGITASYGSFHSFLNEVERQHPDVLVGHGDIVELAWSSWGRNMAWQPARSAIEHLIYIASILPVELLPGNHDLDLIKYKADLKPIIVSPCLTAQYDGVLYTHGHQFDPVYKSTWAWIMRLPLAHLVAPCIARSIYGTPYARILDGKDDSYMRLTAIIEADILLHTGDKPVVFGHTHSEFIRRRRNSFLANSGDLIDSCSTLKVIDGSPELVWF